MKSLKKTAIVIFSLALIVSFLALFFGDTVDDGYFYSPSDGRRIKKGSYWGADAPGHFSVRYIGFSADVPDNIADIYICIQDIYADQSLVLPLQMYNHENRLLYFTIEDNGTDLTGQAADYAFSTKEMGSVSGDGGLNSSWTYTITADNIPGSLDAEENMDTINLRISSWEDSEYSVLYTRDNFEIRIHYIDREDIGWNILLYENFDDQTADNLVPLWVGMGKFYTATNVETEFHDGIYRSENYSWRTRGVYGSADYPTGFAVNLDSINENTYLIASIRRSGHSGGSCGLDVWANVVNQGSSSGNGVGTSPAGIASDEWYQIVVPVLDEKLGITYVTTDFQTGWAYVDDVYVIQR